MWKAPVTRIFPFNIFLNTIKLDFEQPQLIGRGEESPSSRRGLLGCGKMDEAVFGIELGEW